MAASAASVLPLARDYEFRVGDDFVSVLIAVLLTTLFVWLAARIVVDRSSLVAALLTALVGNFLAFLVWGAVGGIPGLVLAVLAWGLVAALFFRTAWLKGAVIGVVAWLLWFLTNLVLDWLGR